ncbi:hypothetical protein C4577_06985 [Candidatus Parcubacteria bacterium]|nr:MAG: hypothetical protein C4577_06985 [Candidatus Parcubacteria bacterium]
MTLEMHTSRREREVAFRIAQRQEQEARRGTRVANISPEIRGRATDVYRVFQEFSRGGIVNPNGITMQKMLESRIGMEAQIRAVLFWGGSDKPAVDDHDLRFIRKLRDRLQSPIQELYPTGLATTVIFGDVHVLGNGYIDLSSGGLLPETDRYLDQASGALRETLPGLREILWLSDLHRKYNIPPGSQSNPSPEAYKVFEKHRDFLLANAENHSRQRDPVTAAIMYVDTRIREKEILAGEFPDAILIASGIRKGATDIILPEGMPGVFSNDQAPWFRKDTQ